MCICAKEKGMLELKEEGGLESNFLLSLEKKEKVNTNSTV